MAEPMIGMNIPGVEDVTKQFRAARGRLDAVKQACDGPVNSIESWWRGPDAQQFKGEYGAKVKSAIDNLQSFTDQIASAVEAQVAQQRQTSA